MAIHIHVHKKTKDAADFNKMEAAANEIVRLTRQLKDRIADEDGVLSSRILRKISEVALGAL